MGEFADMEIENMLDRMCDPDFYMDEEDSYYRPKHRSPPRMLDLEVAQVHARTEKAVCVTGTTSNGYALEAIWLPISQIDMNGNMVRFPEWILKKRIENDDSADRARRHLGGIDRAADNLMRQARLRKR